MAYESSSGEVPAEAVEYSSVSWGGIVGKVRICISQEQWLQLCQLVDSWKKSQSVKKCVTNNTLHKKAVVRLVSLC